MDVGQKLRVVFAGVIQTLPMQTQDPYTVQHVVEDVWLLRLSHLLQWESNTYLNSESKQNTSCAVCKTGECDVYLKDGINKPERSWKLLVGEFPFSIIL